VKGGHTGPDDKVFKSKHYLREVVFCILHLHVASEFRDGCKVAIVFEFDSEIESISKLKCRFGFKYEVTFVFPSSISIGIRFWG